MPRAWLHPDTSRVSLPVLWCSLPVCGQANDVDLGGLGVHPLGQQGGHAVRGAAGSGARGKGRNRIHRFAR